MTLSQSSTLAAPRNSAPRLSTPLSLPEPANLDPTPEPPPGRAPTRPPPPAENRDNSRADALRIGWDGDRPVEEDVPPLPLAQPPPLTLPLPLLLPLGVRGSCNAWRALSTAVESWSLCRVSPGRVWLVPGDCGRGRQGEGARGGAGGVMPRGVCCSKGITSRSSCFALLLLLPLMLLLQRNASDRSRPCTAFGWLIALPKQSRRGQPQRNPPSRFRSRLRPNVLLHCPNAH